MSLINLNIKTGFYICISSTHSSAQWAHSQPIPTLATKVCALAPKSQMLTFSEGCENYAAICCDCGISKPRMQDTENILCPLKKIAKPRSNFITTTFGKSLFTQNYLPSDLLPALKPGLRGEVISMVVLFITQYRVCYMIYLPPNAKELRHNRPYDVSL